MRDTGSLHQKVQEMCDCFATAEPLSEMAALKKDPDIDEGALKWIALAVIHGINDNAKKITISKTRDGEVQVSAKYRKAALPAPGAEIGAKIFDAIRTLTHIEKKGGEIPLALGIRDGSLDVCIEVESKEEGETVTINFPK
jgi:hypothetical protein